MKRCFWVWAMGLVGCNGEDKLLQELDGSWSGAATVDGAQYLIDADFTFTDFLSGEVNVAEPDMSRLYAVKAAEAYNNTIALDLLEVTDDLIRGLDLDGEVSDGAFFGVISMTFECSGQICGYEGDFDLRPGPAVGTTTPGTGTAR